MILSAYTLPDIYHLILSVFPLLLIITSLLKKKGNLWQQYLRHIVVIVIILLFILPTFLNYKALLRSDESSAKILKNLIENNCPGQYIFAGPFFPNLYFITKKLNPSSYNILLTNHHTLQQFEEAVAQIQAKNISCGIFLLPPSLDKFNYNKDNPVYSFFEENYNSIYDQNYLTIFKRP